MVARASEIISDTINTFVEETDSIECNSTEDMCNKLNEAEKNFKMSKRKS